MAVPLVLFRVLPLLIPLLPLAPPIEAWFKRRGELYADRVAAELGYAPALADLFQHLCAQGTDGDEPAVGTLAHLTSTHPPLHARIRQLQHYLG